MEAALSAVGLVIAAAGEREIPAARCEPSTDPSRAGRDEVVEKAVEVLRDWASYRSLKTIR